MAPPVTSSLTIIPAPVFLATRIAIVQLSSIIAWCPSTLVRMEPPVRMKSTITLVPVYWATQVTIAAS